MQLIFKVFGVETVEVEKKKQTPKAKKDTAKEKAKITSDAIPLPQTTRVPPQQGKPQKKETGEVRKPTRKAGETTPVAGPGTKKDEMKHGGSKLNNKINERDLKNAKDKDCQIY